MTPSSLLFAATTFMGTLITLSSTNWLFLWVGMELNLLSFVPLIASSQSLQETEAAVKYFIIQAVGSGLMLTAGMMSMNPFTNKLSVLASVMFIISMTMKLGMAPFHQWLPSVMASISWLMCMALATWQKISPFIMLMYITPYNTTIVISSMAMMSALIGGVGGLNQSQLRALLAYSSIGHMGWMIVTMNISSKLFSFYFIIYIIITMSLMSLFVKNNNINSNLHMSLTTMTIPTFMMTMLIMFSLGGLPPFLGFFPKWAIISALSSSEMFSTLTALILGSLMNLFYYFNMTFNFILLTGQNNSLTPMPITLASLTGICTLTPLIIML